jgi:glycosyltransferase involved in cell wall biosynthesis
VNATSETREQGKPWLIVNAAFNDRGGQELANFELARGLLAAGRSVTLVAHEVDSLLRTSNCKTVCVPRPLGSAFLGERRLELAARIERARMPQETVFVGNAGNCPGAAVSWVHFVHAAWLGDLEAAPARVRAVHYLSKTDALRRERRAMSSARIILANSRRTKSDLVNLLGVEEGRIACVYFGSDGRTAARPVSPAPRARTLLFVGALGWDRRKGLDIALRAFAILARRPDFKHRLIVAGAGTVAPWRTLAASLKLGDRVQFVSFVDKVSALMEEADLLISPSRYESYGLALQEAVCAGLPPLVLADRSGFMERLGPAAADFNVDSEDPARWAERIEGALATLQAFRARVRAARQRVIARTWSDFAHDFMLLGEALPGERSVGGTIALHDSASSQTRDINPS